MVRIARILCPIDLSDVSHQALDYAVTLAQWYDAHITILHVAGDRGAALDSSSVPAPSPVLVTEAVKQLCEPWTSRSEHAEVFSPMGIR